MVMKLLACFGFLRQDFSGALAVLELCIGQAGLQLRDQPAFACQVLGLKACVTMALGGMGFDLDIAFRAECSFSVECLAVVSVLFPSAAGEASLTMAEQGTDL